MVKTKYSSTRKINRKRDKKINLLKKRLSKNKLIGGAITIEDSIIEEIDRIISKMESEGKYKDDMFKYKLESNVKNKSTGLELGKKIDGRQEILKEITKRINEWITSQIEEINKNIYSLGKQSLESKKNNDKISIGKLQVDLQEQIEEFEEFQKTKLYNTVRTRYMIKTAKKYNLEITNSSNIETKYRNLKKLKGNQSVPDIDTMLSELIEIQLYDEALAREKAEEAAESAKAAAEAADGAAAEVATTAEATNVQQKVKKRIQQHKENIKENYKCSTNQEYNIVTSSTSTNDSSKSGKTKKDKLICMKACKGKGSKRECEYKWKRLTLLKKLKKTLRKNFPNKIRKISRKINKFTKKNGKKQKEQRS